MSAAEQARLKVSQLTYAKDFLGAYEYLKAGDLAPDVAPGAWELLWRCAHEAGVHSLARHLQDDLWKAGHKHADIAIERARFAILEGRAQEAADVITDVFGAEPAEPEAADVLAQAVAYFDTGRAITLLKSGPNADIREVLARIDLLRSMDLLREAAEEVEVALQEFDADPRLEIRRARILEALGDWEGALLVWQDLAASDTPTAHVAKQFVIRLLLRFERHEDAMFECARLVTSKAPLINKLIVADLMNQNTLIVELLEKAAGGKPDTVAQTNWAEVCNFLIDRGDIGLAAWLSDLKLPIGFQNIQTLMATTFDGKPPVAGVSPLTRARRIRSPDQHLPFSPGLRAAAEFEFRTAVHVDIAASDQVLLVNATLSAGGAERQLIPLIQALLADGIPKTHIHVAIFSLAKDRGHAHFANDIRALGVGLYDMRNQGVTLAELPPKIRGLVASLPVSLRRDILALWPLLIRIAPRVLHGWQDRSSVACGYLGCLVGIERIIMTARNMKPKERRFEERHFLPVFNLLRSEPQLRLVANSLEGARDYEDWVGLSTGSVGFLPNGIDTTSYGEIAKSLTERDKDDPDAVTRPLVVGGVFRLAANKRPLLWLRTIAALQGALQRPVKVRLVGTGPFEAEIADTARALGLDDIEMIPRLDTAHDLYASIDFLLLMSRVEGTPNVLLEAQACGLPVVACDVGGVRNAVLGTGPGRGLVLPAMIEPQDAAARIADFLPAALSQGVAERHAFVERTYGLKRLEQDILALYGPEFCNRLASGADDEVASV